MRADNIGALPVGENDRLVGMVTDCDIAMWAVAEERPSGNTSVREVRSERVYYCFDDDLEDAASIMTEHQIHCLPVLKRGKGLVGMLAIADLARSDGDAMKTALARIPSLQTGPGTSRARDRPIAATAPPGGRSRTFAGRRSAKLISHPG